MRRKILIFCASAVVIALVVYATALRERIVVSINTSDELPADVVVNVVAVYRENGAEQKEPPRTIVVSTDADRTLALTRKWPTHFVRLQVSAGHPRYRRAQQYEVRNPHWRSRRINIELAAWAKKPGGIVVAPMDNIAHEASEHLTWVRDVYLREFDTLSATRALMDNHQLLRVIAFAGDHHSEHDTGIAQRITKTLDDLENTLAQNVHEPCPPGYEHGGEGPMLCGQQRVEVVWPRQP